MKIETIPSHLAKPSRNAKACASQGKPQTQPHDNNPSISKDSYEASDHQQDYPVSFMAPRGSNLFAKNFLVGAGMAFAGTYGVKGVAGGTAGGVLLGVALSDGDAVKGIVGGLLAGGVSSGLGLLGAQFGPVGKAIAVVGTGALYATLGDDGLG